MIKKLILKIIKFYQLAISPLGGKSCRFYPSCSKYMSEKIEKKGLIKGFFSGFLRILKCHPFNQGGVDLP